MSQSTSSGAGKFFNAEFFKGLTPVNTLFPLNFTTLLDLQTKNFQAIAEANKIVAENIQAIVQRQTQILTQIVEDNTSLAQQIMTEGTPEEKVTRQADLARDAYERSVSGLTEITELVSKSQREAGEVINKRVTASLTEFKDSIEKAKEKAAA